MNRMTLIGNLGADPEVRHSLSGATVCNFKVAVTEKWKDKDGVKQEETEWCNIVAWGKLAEICSEYLEKGVKVYIGGKLRTRKWQDKEGVERYTTEIVAHDLEILSKKKNDSVPDKYGGPFN